MRESAGIKALFIGPAFVFFLFFMMLPVVASIGLVFASWTGFSLNQIEWNGVANFETAFGDPVFWRSFGNTALFVVATTVLVNILGFLLALLTHSRVRGHEFLRIAVFLPLAVSPVITAILWQFLLGPYGFINQFLKSIGLADKPVEFLGSPDFAMWTVIAAAVWQTSGLNLLLFYAGLQSLSTERLEAAALDGARYWSRVRWVMIPHLRPVIAIAVVLNLIGGWKVFDLVFVLTKGGPMRSTEVLSTYMYEQAFEQSHFGYAAVMVLAIVVFAIISTLVRRPITGAQYS